jgi:hypothetical protein
MAGIFYGWIGVYYGEMAKMIDTWGYHVESLHEYEILKNDPIEFFASLFRTSYDGGYANFLTTKNSWWNDVKGNFLIRVMAIFNLFSFGQYYTNVIFYSFITMFGPVCIYKVMKDFASRKNTVLLLFCFAIPSFLYWTSGLHKEGLIFLGLALMTYHFYFGFKEKKFGFKRIAAICLGFLLVLILRNFLIVTLLPPLLAWFVSEKSRVRPVFIFLGVALVSGIIFFASGSLNPKLDFPQATVTKQGEFLQLTGGSTVPVKLLEPSLGSFVTNAPQAISLSILRPYPSDVRHLLSLAASLEINFLILFFVLFLFIRRKGGRIQPFTLFCIFLSLAILMMIGYTVNNLGAIVRYRSIVLPFLIVPMAIQMDWDKLAARLGFNITIKNKV